MKIKNPYTCDVCGAGQGDDTKNWWVVFTSKDMVYIVPWIKANTDADDTTHVCGMSCALSAASRRMQEILNQPKAE